MNIIKRNGSTQEFDINKIRVRVETQINEIAAKSWNPDVVKNKFNIDAFLNQVSHIIVNNMKTVDIDLELVNYCASQLIYDEVYEELAVRLLSTRLHKELDTLTDINNYVKVVPVKSKKRLVKYWKKMTGSYQADIKVDNSFTYYGYCTLLSIYLTKSEGVTIEAPSFLYARVANALSNNYNEFVSLYSDLVNKKISLASPVLFSAGLKNPSMISCTLQSNADDSREGMLDTFSQLAASSSDASGIGLYVGGIRSAKSHIGLTGGKAMGLVRHAKIVNELGKGFDQKGKRKGSIAEYCDIYHKDIREFLQLRMPQGQENLRARDLFIAVNIPNNFYEALLNDKDYYLFCPNDLKKHNIDFTKVHGTEFETLYNTAVELGLGEKVNPKDIWHLVLSSQLEAGIPYINNIDHANRTTNHSMYGKIRSSNLCIEIQQYHDEKTTANCCLGAVVVDNFIVNKKVDVNALYKAVKSLVYALNKVIDINKYSTKQAKAGAKQRAIAIGMVGLADAFIKNEVEFESDEALDLSKEIQKSIYISALKASHEYSKEYGVVYDKYELSNHYKNIAEFNHYDDNTKLDFLSQGMANSLVVGNMPTASTSFLLGRNECFEPFTNNIYERENLVGKFVIINPYLRKYVLPAVNDSTLFINKIISNGGSLQFDWSEFGVTKEFENKYKPLFKTVWEISMKKMIEHCKVRQPYVDQAQSMNLYLKEPTLNKLSSMLIYSWKSGLKTGIYYLRVKTSNETNKKLGISISSKSESNSHECLGCTV